MAALAMANAVPYQLLKRGKDIYLPCSTNPGFFIYANLNPFPPVSNQLDDYTVEGVMDYDITPNKTEIIIIFADSDLNVIGNVYTKVLEINNAKNTPFSIDVPDVPTPQLPSAYLISVAIADETDNPNYPDIHACVFVKFGF